MPNLIDITKAKSSLRNHTQYLTTYSNLDYATILLCPQNHLFKIIRFINASNATNQGYNNIYWNRVSPGTSSGGDGSPYWGDTDGNAYMGNSAGYNPDYYTGAPMHGSSGAMFELGASEDSPLILTPGDSLAGYRSQGTGYWNHGRVWLTYWDYYY